MGTIGSQITRLTTVYSTVYSGPDQRKHQSSASLAFVGGIHRWPVNSPHKGPVTRKKFLFDDVIMTCCWCILSTASRGHWCFTKSTNILNWTAFHLRPRWTWFFHWAVEILFPYIPLVHSSASVGNKILHLAPISIAEAIFLSMSLKCILYITAGKRYQEIKNAIA